MYLALIDEHLQQIMKIQKDETVLVYKGFPIDFVREIARVIPLCSQEDELFTDGRINLQKIKDNSLKLITSIQRLTHGTTILLFEEFLNLHRNINLNLFNRQFVIINNNFFSEYPNQSTETFIDIQDSIEHNESFDENELFSYFYVDSFDVQGTNYVQYQDIDTADLKCVSHLDFFDPRRYKSYSTQELESKNLTADMIVFNESDNNYRLLKQRIFEGKQLQKVDLITDAISESNPTLKRELRILNHLFFSNGLQLLIYLKSDYFNKESRQELLHILKKHWKSDSFKTLEFYSNPNISTEKISLTQGEIIDEIVKQAELAQKSGPYADVFLTAPTGAGKSVLFQIPAIYLARKYSLVTIVVSPLKALMLDQVQALRDRGVEEVAFINSDISLIERDDIVKKLKAGNISILYLSPELLLSYDISMFIGDRRIGLFVIDEAHLVTTWGRDFRVDYWYLGIYLRKLRRATSKKSARIYSFPVFALTATAVYNGPNDMVFQTISSLNMLVPELFIGNSRRDEVCFEISKFETQLTHEAEKINKTSDRVNESIDKSTKSIFYFPWISQINQLCDLLPSEKRERVGRYFGSLEKDERREVVEKFKNGEISVVLATKAFGMGVDISDIRQVYHHAPSGNLADYVQEVGRVARDKKKGIAKTDFNPKDLKFSKILYGLSSIKQYQARLVLQKINDIFKLRKAANFLVSVEDFGFVFNLADDNLEQLEQKVKSALLVVEKDLIAKYGYNIIVVRPKSLYSRVFIKVAKEVENNFVNQYSRFLQNINFSRPEQRIPIPNGVRIIHPVPGPGYSFFELALDKLWEQSYQEYSFPYIKKKFFDRELFPGREQSVIPQYKIRIELKGEMSEVSHKLILFLNAIEDAITSLAGHFFTKQELDSRLKKAIGERTLRRRIVDLILTLYTSTQQTSETFLVMRTRGEQQEIRVINYAYTKIRHDLEQKLHELFPKPQDTLYESFISADSDANRLLIKTAYAIESFSLGNYEIIGGKLPQIFIRVNDPLKLNVLSRRQYENGILSDIERRHRDSMAIMDRFFQTQMHDKARWDFIENYFLGKQLEPPTISMN
jgi:ATP-dependent DNA helicase RecQ